MDPNIGIMAEKYHTTVPKFLLAWALCQGMSVLPRSKNAAHIRENLEAADIRVSGEDVESVKSSRMQKYCWDPEGIV